MPLLSPVFLGLVPPPPKHTPAHTQNHSRQCGSNQIWDSLAETLLHRLQVILFVITRQVRGT